MHPDHLKYVSCDLCSADSYRVVYPARYEREKYTSLQEKFRSSGDETLIDQVVQCLQCGLIYVNPRLEEGRILKGYAEAVDEDFVSQAKAREKTFRRCLSVVERFWYRTEKGKLLDIGTAGGSFLHVAKCLGWEVAGCEPNRWLCRWAKEYYGLSIYNGEIFDMQCAKTTFDVVTLWDVLEHTPAPKKIVEECYRILKPHGLLVINYPDIGSSVAKVMGRQWVFLLSVHLYYFTRESVQNLLRNCGFSVVQLMPHIQTLELGYVFRRMQAYHPLLGRLGASVTKTLKVNRWPIPYWMGQTLAIARKS